MLTLLFLCMSGWSVKMRVRGETMRVSYSRRVIWYTSASAVSPLHLHLLILEALFRD
jgi:hypothetical protein